MQFFGWNAAVDLLHEAASECAISWPGLLVWLDSKNWQSEFQANPGSRPLHHEELGSVPEPGSAQKLARRAQTKTFSETASRHWLHWSVHCQAGDLVPLLYIASTKHLTVQMLCITLPFRPLNQDEQKIVSSDYKPNTTIKYLVALNTHGAVMFMSEAFGGRTSDEGLTLSCGESAWRLLHYRATCYWC